jgi:hypothetical protein
MAVFHTSRAWVLAVLGVIAGCASQAAPPPVAPVVTTRTPTTPSAIRHEPLALAVYKKKRQLMVFRHGIPEETFTIRLGPNPSGTKIWRGDNRTPEGTYRICRIKPSRFRAFMWISYPNRDDARKALEAGQITFGEYDRIVEALRDGDCPPADTALGGLVGIHGDYTYPPRLYDWTEGCIAMPRESELDRLVSIVRPGVPVLILP